MREYNIYFISFRIISRTVTIMINFIYTINNNLDISLCNSLINLFNEKEKLNFCEESMIDSKTGEGKINRNVRNSLGLNINKYGLNYLYILLRYFRVFLIIFITKVH